MPFEVNQIVEGVVKSITKFGAFVDIGGKVGLVHISEVADGFVKEVSEYLKEDDNVKVKIISIKEGKVGLSIRQAQPKKPEQQQQQQQQQHQQRPRNNNFKKHNTTSHTPTFDERLSQFLKDSEERQQALKKSAKKSRNKSFNR